MTTESKQAPPTRVRILLTEDGAFREYREEPGSPGFSCLGCYDTSEAAVRAATFLLGPEEREDWSVLYSEHGWWYIEPVARAEGGAS